MFIFRIILFLTFIAHYTIAHNESASDILHRKFYGPGNRMDINIRPVHNSSLPVVLYFGIALRQVIHLDAKQEVLSASVWVREYWKNDFVKWNACEYDGVDIIHVNSKEHWKPDVVLYNNAYNEMKPMFEDVMTTISSDGTMMYLFPSVFHTACTIDVTFFPFDQQVCVLKFGSWAYDGRRLDIVPKAEFPADARYYQFNNEWMLVNMTWKRNVLYYGCCPDAPYPDISFHITLRRRFQLYLFYLLLPNLMISILCCVQFELPCDSAEKMDLGVNLLLSLVIYILVLTDMLPMSDHIPILAIYFGTTIVLVFSSMLINIVILHIHHNGHHDNHAKLPPWARKLILHRLARIVRLHSAVTSDEDHEEKLEVYECQLDLNECSDTEEKETNDVDDGMGPVVGLTVNDSAHIPHNQVHPIKEQNSRTPSRGLRRSSIFSSNNRKRSSVFSNRTLSSVSSVKPATEDVKDIYLHRILAHLEDEKLQKTLQASKKEQQCEWQEAAMVINRICTYIYLFVSSVVFIAIFSQIPTYTTDS